MDGGAGRPWDCESGQGARAGRRNPCRACMRPLAALATMAGSVGRLGFELVVAGLRGEVAEFFLFKFIYFTWFSAGRKPRLTSQPVRVLESRRLELGTRLTQSRFACKLVVASCATAVRQRPAHRWETSGAPFRGPQGLQTNNQQRGRFTKVQPPRFVRDAAKCLRFFLLGFVESYSRTTRIRHGPADRVITEAVF